MSRIEIEPTSFTVRLFADGKGYWDEYEAIMTIQKMGHIAFETGLHGNISRVDHDRYCDLIRELHGVTELRWLKHGSEKNYNNES